MSIRKPNAKDKKSKKEPTYELGTELTDTSNTVNPSYDKELLPHLLNIPTHHELKQELPPPCDDIPEAPVGNIEDVPPEDRIEFPSLTRNDAPEKTPKAITGKPGMPEFIPNKEQRKFVQKQIANGFTIGSICELMDISYWTFAKYFKEDKEIGKRRQYATLQGVRYRNALRSEIDPRYIRQLDTHMNIEHKNREVKEGNIDVTSSDGSLKQAVLLYDWDDERKPIDFVPEPLPDAIELEEKLTDEDGVVVYGEKEPE